MATKTSKFSKVIVVLLSMIAVLCSVNIGKVHGLKCWYGEDYGPSHKTLDCETGETLEPGHVSRKRRTQNSTSTSPAYCFVFKYFEELDTGSHHEDQRAITTKAIFSCDFSGLCQDKAMERIYGVKYEDHVGDIVCCNMDNCNVHRLEYMSRKCYQAERNSSHAASDIEEVPVPKQYTACLKIIKRRVDTDQTVILQEYYNTDDTSLCELKNLTNVQNQACLTTLDKATKVETELCCCYQDRCFKPDWLAEKTTSPASKQKDSVTEAQSSRGSIVLYVCIGLACAFVLTLAIVLGVRHYRRSKYTDSSKPFSKMAYHSMRADGQDSEADNVQILTAINHNSSMEDRV